MKKYLFILFTLSVNYCHSQGKPPKPFIGTEKQRQMIEKAVNQTPEAQKLEGLSRFNVKSNQINIYNPYTDDVKVIFSNDKVDFPYTLKSGGKYSFDNNAGLSYYIFTNSPSIVCYDHLQDNINYDVFWDKKGKKFCLSRSEYMMTGTN